MNDNSQKEHFLAKHGTTAQFDSLIDKYAPILAKHQHGFDVLKSLAKNPSLTPEHHDRLIALEHHAIDHVLVSHQPSLHPDKVTELAKKNGTGVANPVYHHPNTSSTAIQHVLDSLIGGGDHEDYANSNVVKKWKAKRDELKAQGK